MRLEPYLINQALLHPSMQPMDAAKLCYQAAYGAEHLLSDIPKAHRMFLEEFQTQAPIDVSLAEHISDEIARVSLPAWKFHAYDPDLLFRLFCASAFPSSPAEGRNRLIAFLTETGDLAARKLLPFPSDAWPSFLLTYQLKGYPPVHHSAQYRLQEHPSYRIVRRSLLSGIV